ncbi:Secretory Carrier-Associated Membrane Protein 4 [Manis pentadactyla]|nr:Secretory Carrier-Associated Membrane Protein 4 [Manis pentadactyla]
MVIMCFQYDGEEWTYVHADGGVQSLWHHEELSSGSDVGEIGKAMYDTVTRELGVNSDVMAKVIYRLRDKTCFLVGINIEGYDVDEVVIDLGTYSDVRVKARLIFIIMV